MVTAFVLLVEEDPLHVASASTSTAHLAASAADRGSFQVKAAGRCATLIEAAMLSLGGWIRAYSRGSSARAMGRSGYRNLARSGFIENVNIRCNFAGRGAESTLSRQGVQEALR